MSPPDRRSEVAHNGGGPLPTTVYTDGACIGNPGPGGWAWALSEERFAAGFQAATTNQRMELSAVIEAVGALEGPLEVVSDSTYVVNCFRDRWWAGWRTRGWRNARGEPVANQDLWRVLVAVVVDERPGQIRFRWVKGHGTDPLNILVDRLANEAARTQVARAQAARTRDTGTRDTGAAPSESQAPAGA